MNEMVENLEMEENETKKNVSGIPCNPSLIKKMKIQIYKLLKGIEEIKLESDKVIKENE